MLLCVCVGLCMSLYVEVCACMFVCMCVYLCVCVGVCLCARTRVCACVRVNTCACACLIVVCCCVEFLEKKYGYASIIESKTCKFYIPQKQPHHLSTHEYIEHILMIFIHQTIKHRARKREIQGGQVSWNGLFL